MAKTATDEGARKIMLGDIVGIPLPDTRFAYARIYRDFTLAVYDLLTPRLALLGQLAHAQPCFFQACTDAAILSGHWPLVGHLPFDTEEDSWYPPKAIGYLPQIKAWALGQPRIRIRGLDRVASFEEVTGLEISTFCQRPELLVEIIVDRLIHGNHAKYKVPQQ